MDHRDAPVEESTAVERLRPLLRAAAELDLDDFEAWSRLRNAARTVLGVLAAGEAIPRHLIIEPDDPPVVITRTLAAAWRQATDGTRRP